MCVRARNSTNWVLDSPVPPPHFLDVNYSPRPQEALHRPFEHPGIRDGVSCQGKNGIGIPRDLQYFTANRTRDHVVLNRGSDFLRSSPTCLFDCPIRFRVQYSQRYYCFQPSPLPLLPADRLVPIQSVCLALTASQTKFFASLSRSTCISQAPRRRFSGQKLSGKALQSPSVGRRHAREQRQMQDILIRSVDTNERYGGIG